VVLFLLVGAFVAYPLLRPAAWSGKTSPAAELFARRDRMYGELRELEFDFRVGKVTEEDYREARENLETEAARVLRAIELRTRDVAEEIERDIQRARSEQRRANLCPSCQAAIAPGVRFCPSCGAAQSVAARR